MSPALIISHNAQALMIVDDMSCMFLAISFTEIFM